MGWDGSQRRGQAVAAAAPKVLATLRITFMARHDIDSSLRNISTEHLFITYSEALNMNCECKHAKQKNTNQRHIGLQGGPKVYDPK